MDILKKIGQTIRERRLAMGISQEKLAELSGLHRTYVGAVERGERNITILNLEKIAKALGINIAGIMKKL